MIQLKQIKTPAIENKLSPVALTDETMSFRKTALLGKMREKGYDSLVIYADLEHGSNFEYLTGFLPRFEEALLILHMTGEAYMVLGNENLNKAGKARLLAKAIHMPHFSLPNQPMPKKGTVEEILSQCTLENAKKIGLVGWKNFTSFAEDNTQLFELPYYLVQALKKLYPNVLMENATQLFIGEGGIRTRNNANEFAHYEFGAALAGRCILQTMDQVEVGKTEMEIARSLSDLGQSHNVVTIMATGERFEKANIYPGSKIIKKGDRLSMTTGYKGGLQSRGGYAVSRPSELPDAERDYLEVVAKPYFNAVKTWLETVKIGMLGQDLYDKVEEVLPKGKYGWTLNPGHLIADEEWLSSPIYPASTEKLKSGMLFQIDIIPSVLGYGGVSCESGIFLADEKLRANISQMYPEVWHRVQKRRKYIQNELGISLSEEILPTSSATAYLRPFMLDKHLAFTAR
ncbi:M24 family metallopeptidase [Lactococcus ileimucosae]|uniref:M24 family metallopeptidase n=1 Tax=Lactococcus ileimucosae TaxID=2941329 RepID=UPI002043C616|nr:aminopeptidase P family protein [Lactococcus ileimucosae]